MGQVAIRSSGFTRAPFDRYSGVNLTVAAGDTIIAIMFTDLQTAAIDGVGRQCRFGGSAGGVGGVAMTEIGTTSFYDPPTNSFWFASAFKLENIGAGAATRLVEADIVSNQRNLLLVALSANDPGAAITSVISATGVDVHSGLAFTKTEATQANDLMVWAGLLEANAAPTPGPGTVVDLDNNFNPGNQRAAVLSENGAAGSTTLSATLSGFAVAASPGITVVLRAATGDLIDPTLTGVITPGASTSTTINYSWSAGADNVGVTSYERSLDGGATWLNIGNVLTRTDTGLTPSTPYAVQVRALDAAGNDSTPPLALSISTTAAGDGIVPTLTGVITPGAITATTISYSWPAGADNVGVVAYDRSLDGGATWLDVGNVLTRTDTGLTPSTAYLLRVRTRDAAGNVSTPPLAITMTTAAAPTFSAQIGPFATAGIATPNVTVHYTLLLGDGPGGFTQVKQGSVLLNGSGVGTVTHTAAGRGYLVYSPVAPGVVDPDKHFSFQPITLA